MSHHNRQTSIQSNAYSNETQLSLLRQQNKRFKIVIKPSEITKIWKADEFILLLNTILQQKNQYFSIEQLPPLSPGKGGTSYSNKFSFISRREKCYTFYNWHSFFVSVTSLIYDTLFHPLSDTLFEFLKGEYA